MRHRTIYFSFFKYLSFNEHVLRPSQGQSPGEISVELS